uniref:Uncharacterized protein n=1 Tax=Rhipicephalus microplus TaxID=6941 RepID=A0A6G5AIL1_RHIMP
MADVCIAQRFLYVTYLYGNHSKFNVCELSSCLPCVLKRCCSKLQCLWSKDFRNCKCDGCLTSTLYIKNLNFGLSPFQHLIQQSLNKYILAILQALELEVGGCVT